MTDDLRDDVQAYLKNGVQLKWLEFGRIYAVMTAAALQVCYQRLWEKWGKKYKFPKQECYLDRTISLILWGEGDGESDDGYDGP